MENASNLKYLKRKEDIAKFEKVATLLDSKFKIGGFRFGLDPLLNFIPYAGQAITFLTSLGLVLLMLKNGASSKVVVKMLLNVIYDAIVGSIPFFGQIFDFFNKANKKNIALLKEHYIDNKHQGSAIGILLTLLAIIFVSFFAVIYFIWIMSDWLIGLIGSLF